MKKNVVFLISIVLIIGLVMGLVHVFLMPPFQNPDEIQHFLYSASYAYSPRQMELIESQVLELLKEHQWFHFVGIGPGWENIRRISEISFVFHFNLERATARKTLFHYLYGKLLRLSGITNAHSAFYFLRILSTLFFLLILALLFWFFYIHFPETWLYYFVGTVLVFQLVTILNAVNYDVFLVLFGVLFFIAAHGYHNTKKKKYLAFLLITALLATLTKLAGLMFFAFIIILLSLDIKWNLKFIKNFVLVLFVIILGFCWMNFIFPARFFSLYSVVFRMLHNISGSLFSAGEKILNVGLFNSMIDSFYFQTGWMGFKLSEIWYLGLKLFLLLAFMGVLAALVLKRLNVNSKEKKWLVYALIVCILQVFIIWLYYGGRITVQGRYLYPIIIPIIVLVYSGLLYFQQLIRLKRNYIVNIYLIIQVVLTVFAFIRIVSVFYLEVASPHPGL